ncbi:sensor histidine kinase [Quadrisphaera sp. DSM 44207]|uniref:sensor histidine kinase n=1 Tax=Quadrisphaera sp. DSM 44207 TaxID=1881057 RepID=UPI000B860D5E|nr:PAS domain-containing sensor histidine kinase [Quadrisphaera sp. DSM 44207]
MPTLSSLVRTLGALAPTDEEWLHLLVGDWQMLSDLSFADLVLWLPERTGDGFVAIAHCRPSTGATVHDEDVVGTRIARGQREHVDRAHAEGRICREMDPEWLDGGPVREETVPVVHDGRVIAVMSRDTNLSAPRTPSGLEMTYLRCADALARMISEGAFPTVGAPTGMRRGAPRVGDGLIRLDVEGVVTYASPNARSDYRRLGFVGDLIGRSLAEVTAGVVDTSHSVDESLPLVVTGRAPWRTDVESRGASLSLRAVPLTEGGVRVGALILCRDVTELRRREQELLTKDATIREIHHRVKNNLQTVSALLRLQARRIESAEGREALEEAMRRVSTIALVHETLTRGFDETVDFDDVLDRGMLLIASLASSQDAATTRREGRFGTVGADDATALALVLTELITNAVEHGLRGGAGTVTVRADRDGSKLRATVADDGAGLPPDFSPGRGGLGTQIVQALVQGELRGTITWRSGDGGGTEVVVEADLQEQRA